MERMPAKCKSYDPPKGVKSMWKKPFGGHRAIIGSRNREKDIERDGRGTQQDHIDSNTFSFPCFQARFLRMIHSKGSNENKKGTEID